MIFFQKIIITYFIILILFIFHIYLKNTESEDIGTQTSEVLQTEATSQIVIADEEVKRNYPERKNRRTYISPDTSLESSSANNTQKTHISDPDFQADDCITSESCEEPSTSTSTQGNIRAKIILSNRLYFFQNSAGL